MTRREFLIKSLQTLAYGSTTVVCSRCQILDDFVFGESADFRHKVVIVGGGLSGLLCAYWADYFQIPYVLFEASERLGGQVDSRLLPPSAQAWIELGGQLGLFPWESHIRAQWEKIFNLNQWESWSLKLPGVFKHSNGKPIIPKSWEDLIFHVHGISFNQLPDYLKQHWLDSLTKHYAHSKVHLDIFCPVGGWNHLVDKIHAKLARLNIERFIRLQHRVLAIEWEPFRSWGFLVVQSNQGKKRYLIKNLIWAASLKSWKKLRLPPHWHDMGPNGPIASRINITWSQGSGTLPRGQMFWLGSRGFQINFVKRDFFGNTQLAFKIVYKRASETTLDNQKTPQSLIQDWGQKEGFWQLGFHLDPLQYDQAKINDLAHQGVYLLHPLASFLKLPSYVSSLWQISQKLIEEISQKNPVAVS